MKEIVIKIDDGIYKLIMSMDKSLAATAIRPRIFDIIRNGTELPKGHTELIDTKKLIQSVARSADNMKDNGVAPVFDLHEITDLILAQDV